VHWAGHPQLAQHFADAVHSYAGSSGVDLSHHGDQDLAEGLIDLAVNVRIPRPPDWLAAVINDATAQLSSYPRSDAASSAIAEAHDLELDQVLPTAGGAEAFTLLARALRPNRPVVVHPQFTEPEAALRAAGHSPERLILIEGDGFRFSSHLVPDDADLILIGNPTNPTSVLHPRRTIAALVRPGRVVVVDEAFLDAVPGQPETMIDREMTGVVVLRSLTKTWGLAGLRAGYAVGDPAVIAAMAAQQPPWSVSTPALAAITACLSEKAREIAAAAADEIEEQRVFLIEELAAIGKPVAGRPVGPFVLVKTGVPSIRVKLYDEGFAVRRGETFPGLGPDWIRVAVRDRTTSARLVAALQRVTAGGPGHG
jgi:cobyrinic acid a,c-diamide synthase